MSTTSTNAPNKTTHSNKSSWSTILFPSSVSSLSKPKNAVNAEEAPPSQCCSSPSGGLGDEDSGTGWTVVGKTASPSAACGTTPSKLELAKNDTLSANKFFVPVGLESKLHASPKQSSTVDSSTEHSKDKSLRCHKRNQRRARKRAQKRAAQACKETADADVGTDVKGDTITQEQDEVDAQLHLFDMPTDVSSRILSFLGLADLVNVRSCSRWCSDASQDEYLWEKMYKSQFPWGRLCLMPGITEWRLACQFEHTGLMERCRCSYTKETFFEDVIGCGVDFTVNPKTKQVDYISLSQDFLSNKSFSQNKIRSDIFGTSFKLFLPHYFSRDHFTRGLPQIKKLIVRLCPEKKTSRFDPCMILDVFPKIMNTYVVLLSDEGLAASRKAFFGLLRIHRLFLALAHEYPWIKQEALKRLRQFVLKEENRTKTSCPSLGNLVPLMMIVDENDFSWRDMCSPFLMESFDRAVLWICKANPKLERICGPNGKPESNVEEDERITSSRQAMAVSSRLKMFHVYFLRSCCRGSTRDRANAYDVFFGRRDADDVLTSDCAASDEPSNVPTKPSEDPSPTSYFGLTLNFAHFNKHVAMILAVDSWQQFFPLVCARCPPSKTAMAQILRQAVRNSRRKGYHSSGMDFHRIHASGTSKILSKGQTYSHASGLRRVAFHDEWTFDGGAKYLDASCLLYRGKHLMDTIDYQNTNMNIGRRNGVVVHSGDVMTPNGGTHTIHIDLDALPHDVTSLVFVISAWADATLSDILSASISFTDTEAGAEAAPLCTYDLDRHDKVANLTSVIMCKLYRKRAADGWHVLAIGDAHRGAADNYRPIYAAVQRLL